MGHFPRQTGVRSLTPAFTAGHGKTWDTHEYGTEWNWKWIIIVRYRKHIFAHFWTAPSISLLCLLCHMSFPLSSFQSLQYANKYCSNHWNHWTVGMARKWGTVSSTHCYTLTLLPRPTSVWQHICGRVYVLSNGWLIYCGKPQGLESELSHQFFFCGDLLFPGSPFQGYGQTAHTQCRRRMTTTQTCRW